MTTLLHMSSLLVFKSTSSHVFKTQNLKDFKSTSLQVYKSSSLQVYILHFFTSSRLHFLISSLLSFFTSKHIHNTSKTKKTLLISFNLKSVLELTSNIFTNLPRHPPMKFAFEWLNFPPNSNFQVFKSTSL